MSDAMTVELMFSGLFAFFTEQKPLKVVGVSDDEHRFAMSILKESPGGATLTHFPAASPNRRDLRIFVAGANLPLDVTNLRADMLPVLDSNDAAEPVSDRLFPIITVESGTFETRMPKKVCVRKNGEGETKPTTFADLVVGKLEITEGAELVFDFGSLNNAEDPIRHEAGVAYKILITNLPPLTPNGHHGSLEARSHFPVYYEAFKTAEANKITVELCNRVTAERLCLSSRLIKTNS